MKGDFSRNTFHPEKHHAAVLMQQGRVALDADWNEQVAIQQHLLRAEKKDVIGPCGVPKIGGGFEIGVTEESRELDLTIRPGRIYVDGILCELEKEASYLTQPDYPDPPKIRPEEGRTDLVYLDVWERHVTAIEDPQIREVALGGPDTATRVKTIWQVKVHKGMEAIDCEHEIEGWPPVSPLSERGHLSTEVVLTPPTLDPMAPAGGYRGLENHLYRVEIHKGTEPGTTPTFKWSRDNGSVVFAIEEFFTGEPTKVKVKHPGPDQVLALRVGDWIEILGDESELQGNPGTLSRIENIDEAQRVLTLSADVSAHNGEGHPKVRRWDHREISEGALQDGAIPVPEGTWLELEDGVRIYLQPGGTYQPGDYWIFAARTATADIERLIQAEPRGIEHHYCPLALVTWQKSTQERWAIEINDCRREFASLTELADVQPGIRVHEVILNDSRQVLCNDAEVPVNSLVGGLGVVCHERIDPMTIRQPTCFVTLDLPFPLSPVDREIWANEVIGFQPLILAAEVGVGDNIIFWRPQGATEDWLVNRLFRMMSEFRRGERVLAHLTLKGDFIHGGDFESWFWVVA